MAQAFASGKVGSVLVGTVAYGFKDWSIDMDAKQLETSNFTTGGYRTYIGGLIGGSLSFSGPYDVGPVASGGNMPLVVGTSYSFTLGVNATVNLVVTAVVMKLTLSQAIDGMAEVKVQCQVSGSYTSQIS